MRVKIVIYFLLLEIVDITYTTTSRANKLLQNICDTLDDNNGIQLEEDKAWESICQELFHSKDDDQIKTNKRDASDRKNLD